MKTKIAAIVIAAFALLTSACEQHKWSETQKLFKEGEHGKESAEHGKAAGDHAKAEAHGEKNAEEAKH